MGICLARRPVPPRAGLNCVANATAPYRPAAVGFYDRSVIGIESMPMLACRPQPVWAPIVRLRVRVGPAAVRRFVVTVRVNSIDRESCWTRSHVGEEGGEIVAPAVADGDARTTPIFPFTDLRVKAPLEHVFPGSIFARPPIAASGAVLRGARANDVTLQASARLRVFDSQRTHGDGDFLPARAEAQPLSRSAYGTAGRPYNRESRISLTGQVDRRRHRADPI